MSKGSYRWRGVAWASIAVFAVVALACMPGTALAATPLATGTVYNAFGAPIEDATVDVAFWDTDYEWWEWLDPAYTAANGTYVLPDTSWGPGLYLFVAGAEGYAYGSVQEEWDGGAALEIDFHLAVSLPIATGTVTSSEDGQPVEDVWVIAWLDESGVGSHLTGDTHTDTDGTYTVYDMYGKGAGDYRFDFERYGFVGTSREAAWNGDEVLEIDVVLEAAPVIMTGYVRDAATFDFVEGTRIDATAYDTESGEWWLWVGSAFSDVDGSYVLRDQAGYGPGTFKVIAESWSHQPHEGFVTWDGMEVLDIDFTLEGLPPVATGTVTSALDGSAIEDALVEAAWYDIDQSEYWWTGDAWTGPDGGYAVLDENKYGAGSYEFRASAYGFAPGLDYGVWGGVDPVAVDFALDPPQMLATGTVTDALTSAPLEGAWVEAWAYEGFFDWFTWVDTTQTAADGTYALYDNQGIGAGDYRFWAEADDYAGGVQHVTWDGGDPLVVDFALGEPALIATGIVRDADSGAPLDKGWIDASRHNTATGEWEWGGYARVQEDGTWTLYENIALGSGEYRFYADVHPYLYGEQDATWDGVNPLYIEFDLTLAQPVAQGTVLEAGSGTPVGGAEVFADWYDDVAEEFYYIGWARTQEDGTYILYDREQYGAGEYDFTCDAYPYLPQTETHVWNGIDTLTLDFALELPDAMLEGTVTDAADGEPLEDVWVDVSTYDSEEDWYNWIGWATTAEDGTYTVYDRDGYGPGNYTAFAWAETYRQAQEEFTWDGMGPATVDFALEKLPLSFYGVVTDEVTGEPIEGASVYAHIWFDGGDGGWVGAMSTYADGTYALYVDADSTDGGLFTLDVEMEGYLSDSVEDLSSDGINAVEQDFGLYPEGYEPPAPYIPIAGISRFDTAVAASIEAYPDGLDPLGHKAVVIATGRNWPDALGGSALAGALDAPILLVSTNSVPASVLAEVDRLGADKVYIVGGDVAVGVPVVTTLEGAGLDVERVAGGNRYTTADAVALKTIEILKAGPGYAGVAFVATGSAYADAVAAAPLAAANGWPLFLAAPGGMRAGTVTAMTDVIDVLVLGGTNAVSATTYAQLQTEFSAEGVNRLWGTTRYGTAVAIATYGVEYGGLGWDRVGIATGQDYPDALAGGVLQGKMGSVMLLTRTTSLSPEPTAALTANKDAIDTVTFFGGINAVSQTVRNSILAIVE